MEQKMVRVPFDLDTAKKITNGEIKGKIITRDGMSVRIICFDRKDDERPLIALINNIFKSREKCLSFTSIGKYDGNVAHPKDLFIEMPEHLHSSDVDVTEFKPGQPVIGKSGSSQWRYDFFSHYSPSGAYACTGRTYLKCLPYNDKTSHLIGMTNDYKEGKQ